MLWAKQLARVVGVDVHAVSVAVSAFFAGLALGGFAFGRLADRVARPLRLYALLEAAAAVSSVVATLALARAPDAFAALELRIGGLAWILPFALVGVPATWMGGTLPALLRAVEPRSGRIGASGALLYAANTAGAVAGALLVPFALLPAHGIRGSALVAGALQLAAALAALAFDRRWTRATPGALPPTPAAPSAARLALAVYGVAGGVALGYEVVWSQVLVPFLSTRAFAFAIVLATYLTGLALGSLAAARFADRARDPWGTFALLIGLAGLVAVLELALLGRWLVVAQTQAEALALALTGQPLGSLAGMSARFAVAVAFVELAPTVLLGAAFPFALRLATGSASLGRDTGALLAWNTLGGIAGTILAGFVLVPQLGLVRSLAALAVASALLALIAAFAGGAATRSARFGSVAIALLVAALALATPPGRLADLLPAARAGALIFYEEGAGGTVAVVEQGSGRARFRRLYVDGVSNSGDAMPSQRYMRLQALLPLLIHRGEPRSALVIGLGTGITAGALLADAALERRVVAELLPAVARAAPLFSGNAGALADPRIELRLRDGRRELLLDDTRYDLITLEPPPPSAAGVANLYSTEFYALAARRLAPEGLLAQWLPLPTQNEADTRSLVASALQVFPYVTLWTSELHETLLVASLAPIELDVPQISARFASRAVADSLREVGVASPAALLATWIAERAGLERFAAGAPAVTDDDPRIEYAGWVEPRALERVLPELLALATPPPLQGADAAFAVELEQERARLFAFYRAALAAYRGERERAASGLRHLLATDPDNAYYRWFATGAKAP